MNDIREDRQMLFAQRSCKKPELHTLVLQFGRLILSPPYWDQVELPEATKVQLREHLQECMACATKLTCLD